MVGLLFFMIITLFLIHRLGEILGMRVGFMQEHQQNLFGDSESASEIEETTQLSLDAKLTEIRQIYPKFEKLDFINKARAAFEIIFTSYAKGDLRSLKGLVSARVFEAFSMAIEDRKSRGEVLEGNIERFISADIVDADISDESLFVTMKFVTEQSNVLKDKNGKIIEGTEDFLENRTDTWTFFRKKFAVDNKWFLYELKQD